MFLCDGDSKFAWYCDVAEAEESEVKEEDKAKSAVPEKSKEEIALEEMKDWQERLEGKRALAVMYPTPENIKSYIEEQNKVTTNAAYFSDVWRRVIWQNSDVNYSLKRPSNTMAINTYNQSRQSAESDTLSDINQEWGLFFFFRGDCEYCHNMATTLQVLQRHYDITVFPISIDGSVLPEFPDARIDNGMASQLNVDQVPMLMLGNVKDKRIIPIGAGVFSVTDIVERIYVLTSTSPGELY